MLKRFLTICLIRVMLFTTTITANAAGGTMGVFGVNFTMGGSSYQYSTKWWLPEESNEGVYYLSIPHDAVEVKADFIATGEVYIDGQLVKNGDILSLEADKQYVVSCGADRYRLVVLKGSDIPQIFITTEGAISLEDKSAKTSGEIVIIDADGNFEYNGKLSEIKGRGNYTWTLPKKPFNIKLDEKTDLFGMGKSKKFSLLANYIDPTLIKNKLVIDFADSIGIDYSSKSQIVDLYINGDYWGNYTIMERVEIAENRVDIYNLEERNEERNENLPPEDAPSGGEPQPLKGTYKYSELENNPEEITGGYLLEYEITDRYGDEASGFVSEYGQPIVVKSPEYASKEQVEYISDYYQQFEDAVLSDDGRNSQGKHYSEYLDVESMAKMYVLQEFVKNLDSGITSFYLYKDVGGKLVAAPVWDFDSSLGRPYMRYDQNLADPEGLWATSLPLIFMEDQGKVTIIGLLCKHAEFRELAAEQWEKYFKAEIENIVNTVDELSAEIKSSAVVDKTRWNVVVTPPVENDEVDWIAEKPSESEERVTSAVAGVKDFITARRNYLDEFFDTDNSYVQYCANGAEGAMYDYNSYADGDTVVLPEAEFEHQDESKEFLGWNTKANGWGKQYNPGDELTINENLVLYAQWEEPGLIGKFMRFIGGLF